MRLESKLSSFLSLIFCSLFLLGTPSAFAEYKCELAFGPEASREVFYLGSRKDYNSYVKETAKSVARALNIEKRPSLEAVMYQIHGHSTTEKNSRSESSGILNIPINTMGVLSFVAAGVSAIVNWGAVPLLWGSNIFFDGDFGFFPPLLYASVGWGGFHIFKAIGVTLLDGDYSIDKERSNLYRPSGDFLLDVLNALEKIGYQVEDAKGELVKRLEDAPFLLFGEQKVAALSASSYSEVMTAKIELAKEHVLKTQHLRHVLTEAGVIDIQNSYIRERDLSAEDAFKALNKDVEQFEGLRSQDEKNMAVVTFNRKLANIYHNIYPPGYLYGALLDGPYKECFYENIKGLSGGINLDDEYVLNAWIAHLDADERLPRRFADFLDDLKKKKYKVMFGVDTESQNLDKTSGIVSYQANVSATIRNSAGNVVVGIEKTFLARSRHVGLSAQDLVPQIVRDNPNFFSEMGYEILQKLDGQAGLK